jgi:hypothetical protein
MVLEIMILDLVIDMCGFSDLMVWIKHRLNGQILRQVLHINITLFFDIKNKAVYSNHKSIAY